MADLPVAVVEGALEGGLHLRAVEGGQSEDGPAPDGGLVGGCGEDGGHAGFVADGAQGGDRRLPAQGLLVIRDDRAQGLNRGRRALLTQGPRRCFDDHGLRVA